jgi:hypothetical protein
MSKSSPTRARSLSSRAAHDLPLYTATGAPPGAASAASRAPPAVPRRLLTLLGSDERKQYPLATGCLDYFPDALTMVSHISYLGNLKHNPGQELHWARGKSNDHVDCAVRHMVERGTVDDAGAEHLAQFAWRALADLQEYLEKKFRLDLPRGATVE